MHSLQRTKRTNQRNLFVSKLNENVHEHTLINVVYLH